MATVQPISSTPPFVGLLTPFGRSQERYLIELSQRTSAASRDDAIRCSVRACLEIRAGLQRMTTVCWGWYLTGSGFVLSRTQLLSLDGLPSQESSPDLLAQHLNELMRIIFFEWWKKRECSNFGCSSVFLACPKRPHRLRA